MKLSVVSSVFGGMSLDDALSFLSSQGVPCLELGVGGYPGTALADANILVKDEQKRNELVNTFKKHNMSISALAVHGNCVHPNAAVRESFEADFRAACELAGMIGVDTIITFSGCPGSDPDAKQPSWVTCAWPPEFLEELDYQWNEVLIPYWKGAAEFAKAHGVKKIALEMHPGFAVYNPETCLKLRNAVGDIIGANLDPSHLIWQGMDIPEVIRYLGDAILYFHAKDTELIDQNIRKNGVLDTKHYSDLMGRSWVFRTIGYGHGAEFWAKIISALKVVGYDGPISIEHEDALMSPTEGLKKAISVMDSVIIKENAGEMWWA